MVDFGSASAAAENHPGASRTVMSPKVSINMPDKLLLVEDFDPHTDQRFLTEVV